jgi:hypothetical protein
MINVAANYRYIYQKGLFKMISWSHKLTRWALIGTAGLLITSVVACKPSDSDPLKWTEDVKLPDGRIVTLTRYQEFQGAHEIGDTPNQSDYWLEFKNPATGEIVKWEQKGSRLSTLALMMDGETPTLLVTPDFGNSSREFNNPNPPYLIYRYEGSWVKAELSSIPTKQIRVNMTFSPKESRKLIIESSGKLSASATSASEFMGRPYLINFAKMKRQTFGKESHGRKIEWLVE